ncbi:MAG: helix-turn-helix transcriptional regulator [Acidobacteria bacterium]|nr:helix-turn-helix transcriptional regulator [Acidobacteriota bacterium]
MSKRRGEQSLTAAALLFAALGDQTRLALLDRLSQGGPASISVLADRFHQSRQGITKHLQVLAAAGIISGRRQGREHVWALNPARLAECWRRIEIISRAWDDALTRLTTHLEGNDPR